MNKKNIPIIVQLKQNNNYIVTGIEQNDAGVLFDMKIMDGLESFDFSGASIVTLKVQKPDGTFYVDSDKGDGVDVIDPENGRIKLNIPTSCTYQNGMHFCSVGFGYDETTLFATTTFNYFVGQDVNPDNEDIIGTDEFPVLSNLIAQTSGLLSAEEVRMNNESERQAAEVTRQTVYEALIASLNEEIAVIEEELDNAQTMLEEVYEAIAQGGSVDISTITALATKTYVLDLVKSLNFNGTGKHLVIRADEEASLTNVWDGELAYAIDTNRLYIGNEELGGLTLINGSPYIAGSAAPTDTTKLWIDTSDEVPLIKYYNGSAWVSCNTAVFG